MSTDPAATSDVISDAPAAPPPTEPPAAEEPVARPPNLTEAITQMKARVEAGEPVPARPEPQPAEPGYVMVEVPADELGEEYADEGYGFEEGYGPEGGYDEPAEGEGYTLEEALADVVDDRVQEVVRPYLEAIEGDLRKREVMQLVERYPRLSDPEVLADVAAEMDALAAEYGDESMRTDPRLLKSVYLAYEAELAMERGEPVEPPKQGATMETNAGPGGAPPQKNLDPVEAAFLDKPSNDLITG